MKNIIMTILGFVGLWVVAMLISFVFANCFIAGVTAYGGVFALVVCVVMLTTGVGLLKVTKCK